MQPWMQNKFNIARAKSKIYERLNMDWFDSVQVKIKFSDDYPLEKIPPVYATGGAACVDIRSIEDVILMNHSQVMIRTGLHFEIPEGYVLKLYSRSGHGVKGVRLSNCVGIIDSDYRGEVKALLTSDSLSDLKIKKGDRIMQGMLEKVIPIRFQVVDELSTTDRGEKGFGSTNV